MPKAYKKIIFNNLDAGGSKTKVVNTQTSVHSCLFLRLRNFQLKTHIIAIREVFFFWLHPILQHRAHEDNLKFKGQIVGCPDRPDKIGIILWHNVLLVLASLGSIEFYRLVKDKRVLLSFIEGFALFLCGFRQYLPNILTLKSDTIIHVAKT